MPPTRKNCVGDAARPVALSELTFCTSPTCFRGFSAGSSAQEAARWHRKPIEYLAFAGLS